MIARRREKNWVEFVDWCRARRLKPLPAHPWTVAAYARWLDTHYRRPNVSKRIEAIARAHLFYCAPPPDRHPTVTSTLNTIERRHRTQGSRAALFPSEDFAAPAGKKPSRPRPKPVQKAKDAKAPGKAPSKTPNKTPGTPRRSLRSAPPLVSRRPADR